MEEINTNKNDNCDFNEETSENDELIGFQAQRGILEGKKEISSENLEKKSPKSKGIHFFFS